jgi:hypothetical protein
LRRSVRDAKPPPPPPCPPPPPRQVCPPRLSEQPAWRPCRSRRAARAGATGSWPRTSRTTESRRWTPPVRRGPTQKTKNGSARLGCQYAPTAGEVPPVMAPRGWGCAEEQWSVIPRSRAIFCRPVSQTQSSDSQLLHRKHQERKRAKQGKGAVGTSAPPVMSRLLCSMKPEVAPEAPLSELRTDITTGMSAPPAEIQPQRTTNFAFSWMSPR